MKLARRLLINVLGQMSKKVQLDSRLRIMSSSEKLAGEEGLEPSHRDPESRVLPLDDSPKTDVTESKSNPLAGLSTDILPSVLPQKAAGKGLQIQSLLSYPRNPPIISPHSTDFNTPIFYYLRHGSLVPCNFPSWIYTSAIEGSLYLSSPQCINEGREVILC